MTTIATEPSQGKRIHVAWPDLTPQQQQAFIRLLVSFIEESRYEYLIPDILTRSHEEFAGVMLSKHDDPNSAIPRKAVFR